MATSAVRKLVTMPQLRIRNLRPNEVLPTFTAQTGFERLKVLPEWVWVAEDHGRVVAALFACNGHGMLILLRIVTTLYSPPGCLVPLLRQTFRDAKTRGLLGFVAQFDQEKPQEQRLLKIAVQAGAQFMPQNIVNAFASFARMGHIWRTEPSGTSRKPKRGKS